MQKIDYSQLIGHLSKYKYFLIDEKLKGLYPELNRDDAFIFWVKDPEQNKNLKTYEEATNFFLGSGITRKDQLIAIGGGATTDLGGFCASSLLRGLGWTAIPTTLLGMIDAAIGGKVGINTKHGKNLLGAFHHPHDIFICDQFLETLAQEEVLSGRGELIKYFYLSKNVFDAWESEEDFLLEAAKFKEQIVAEDFKEKGKRKILNLGHTIGHALESSLKIPHGVAVAHGMYWMIQIFSTDQTSEFLEILKKLEIDLKLSHKADFETFSQYLKQDKKKVNQDEIELIIPKGVGSYEIERTKLESFLDQIQKHELYNTYFK